MSSSKPSTAVACEPPNFAAVTYLTFHLVFILPVIALAWAVRHLVPSLRTQPLAGVGAPRSVWAIPLTCAIAFVYTTPWDNYIIREGVWTYGADRVIDVIGYVPVEEYAFFLLQPVLVGLWLYRALERKPFGGEASGERVRWTGAALFGAMSLAGFWLLAGPRPGFYMGMILGGFGPVLAGLWLYGGPHFAALADRWGPVVAVVTLYLWACDRFAIANGIWDITTPTSFDIDPLGLPVEEAMFFLVTNLLSVFSILLFLHGDRIRPFWKQ